jgi:ABC transporter with metal-binding/Fe-S-binding domain ATP-binding protein
MKVAALFSGGKDSVFAIYIAQQYGWEITHLVSIYPENKDSWMYHSVNIHLTKTLSEALSIPLISQSTKGEKEQELESLKELLEPLDIDGVITGAIASEYQRTRVEQICHDLHLKSFTPLWHKNQTLLLKDMVQAGFIIKIVCVSADGLDQSYLGKTIDEKTIAALQKIKERNGINIAGEGGEYETLVIDGPLFQKKLLLTKTSIQWKRDHGHLLVEKATLTKKN